MNPQFEVAAEISCEQPFAQHAEAVMAVDALRRDSGPECGLNVGPQSDVDQGCVGGIVGTKAD